MGPPVAYQVLLPYSFKTYSLTKTPASYRARGETPTMSFALGVNHEGKKIVGGKASRIQSSRIGSALVFVRRNAQPCDLKLPESTRFVFSTVVMIAIYTDGPTGCLLSPPRLSPQNIQSHEKAPAGHGDCCGTAHRLLLATYCCSYCYNTWDWDGFNLA